MLAITIKHFYNARQIFKQSILNCLVWRSISTKYCDWALENKQKIMSYKIFLILLNYKNVVILLKRYFSKFYFILRGTSYSFWAWSNDTLVNDCYNNKKKKVNILNVTANNLIVEIIYVEILTLIVIFPLPIYLIT